jgi:hypothetical protein
MLTDTALKNLKPPRRAGRGRFPHRRPVRSRTTCCVLYDNKDHCAAKYGNIWGIRVNGLDYQQLIVTAGGGDLERALGTLLSLDVLEIEPSHEAASCGSGGGNSIGVSRVDGQGRKPRDPDL